MDRLQTDLALELGDFGVELSTESIGCAINKLLQRKFAVTIGIQLGHRLVSELFAQGFGKLL